MYDEKFDNLSRNLTESRSRRSLFRMIGGGAAMGALATTGLKTADARKNKAKGTGNNPLERIKVRGVNNAGKLAFKGRFDVESFEQRGGTIYAVGMLTGKVKKASGGNKTWTSIAPREESFPLVLEDAVGAASTSASRARATCTILDLTLGPIDLNLLGLRVQTNTIRVRITAQRGGGLLGDLLCAVADLLSGGLGGVLNQLTGLLNQILGALQGI
jgi:hypothetical protein